jgi:3-deoxy-manno-octulosonate cytidylyltransferase (CMP-KDO synthetase)
MSEILGVIPARFDSTRFPGKPLADLVGKPMIQHVWEKVVAVIPAVVATDDYRIADAVCGFGGKVIMTSKSCLNGTIRAAEVLANWEGESPQIVLNIQGDEPLVQEDDIRKLIQLMRRTDVEIGTLVTKASKLDLASHNNCFVECREDGLCISFSRVPNCSSDQFWRHVGMYGFRSEVLKKIVGLSPTSGELNERLEQLRWHESGYKIYSTVVSATGPGVDCIEDLIEVRKLIKPLDRP